MSISECCLKGFEWNGTPTGHEIPFPTTSNQAYVTGKNDKVAILFTADLFGWKFINLRLLADHFAREIDATVYLPDFFDNEGYPSEVIANQERWGEMDFPGFLKRNSRENREPEVIACARHLRSKYEKVAGVGYCYGGWTNLRLGSKDFNKPGEPPLIDCISIGHPSLTLKDEYTNCVVPIQVLAPEHDEAYTSELKQHTFETFLSRSVPFEYRHFPGVEHSCFTRGDPSNPKEQDAMVKGKNAAVGWMREWLHPTS